MHSQSALRLRTTLLSVSGVVITVVPWRLSEGDIMEGHQRVSNPFSQVVAPTSGDSKFRTEQLDATHSESPTEESA